MKPRRFPKKKSDLPRKEYLDALVLETVRAAALEGLPWTAGSEPFDEDEAALCSVWLLLNPLKLDARNRVECAVRGEGVPRDDEMPPLPPRTKYFTAHSHTGEPTEPSPDDLLRYHILDEEHGAGVNYIVDRFLAVRLEEGGAGGEGGAENREEQTEPV